MIGVDARMFCRPINTAFGQVTVRPIVPGDADMMQVFVANLSGPARYFRFFQPLILLPQNMLKRLTCIDYDKHMALVAMASLERKKYIVGEARYVCVDDGAAEIALVVADEWQCRGIGTGLLRTLERIAAANGIARFIGEALACNDQIRKFARTCGFKTWSDKDPAYLRLEKDILDIGSPVSKGRDFAGS
jgi:acetyltransferase